MAANRTTSLFAGMPKNALVGDNFETWVAFANPTFVVNDVLYLAQIPNGSTLYYFFIELPGLDTGTSLVLNVGDNVTTTSGGVGGAGYFGSATTAGRSSAAGYLYPGVTGYVNGSVPKTYSLTVAEVPVAGMALGTTATAAPGGIWLTLTVATAANTATTTGSVTGYIKYTFSPSTASQTNPLL